MWLHCLHSALTLSTMPLVHNACLTHSPVLHAIFIKHHRSDSRIPASLTGQQTATGQTALYENIGPHDALWTFDMKACTWQKRHATGDLPEPHLANALAVVNSKAYALVNDPEGTRRLEVYELDLGTWVWRRVPPLGTQPSCRRAASAVVTQVSLIVTGI